MRQKTQAELGRVSAAVAKTLHRTPLTLVLENVRSGANVGSVLRTADAFALAEVCLVGITPRPPHREILKTSLGAEETVAWSHYAGIEECLGALRQNGTRILALEQATGSYKVGDARFGESLLRAGGLALVLGNEVRGVTQAALDRCDGAVEVPQFGMKHSLNVSVAAGIVSYLAAVARQRPTDADGRAVGVG